MRQRKKTLLKEYEQSGKSSVFVDKRIGEENDVLQEFNKAIMRSQRERQMKLNKKSKYNLFDEDDNDFDISGDTSLGNFSGRDDFDEELLLDDDAAEAEPSKMSAILKQLDAHNTQNTRYNDSVEGDENRRKSKKEVMEEVILKSKYFKAQKAKEKEDNEQLMDELDKKFTSMVKSEVLLSTTEPGKLTALKALVNRSIPAELMKKDELSAAQKIETSMHDKPNAYDKLVKSMSLDICARPSDRTKTPEEIAVEKREQLEKLEEERQKRMHATDDSSDEDNDNVEKPSAPKQRSISGDDRGDSFMLDDEPGTRKGWVDEIIEREDEENSESEEDDSSEESESTGGSAGEDDEGSGRDDHEDDEGCAKTVSFKGSKVMMILLV